MVIPANTPLMEFVDLLVSYGPPALIFYFLWKKKVNQVLGALIIILSVVGFSLLGGIVKRTLRPPVTESAGKSVIGEKLEKYIFEHLESDPTYLENTKGMSKEEINQLLSGRFGRGLNKIDDTSLISYFQTTTSMVYKDDQYCSMQFLSSADEVKAKKTELIETHFKEEDYKVWGTTMAKAAIADLNNLPTKPPSEELYTEGLQAIADFLGDKGDPFVAAINKDPAELTPKEACYLVRTIYGNLDKIDPVLGGNMARYLSAN